MKGAIAMPQTQRQFEVEQAAQTLIRAEEIRADPKLRGAVKVELRKQAKASTAAAAKVGAKAGTKRPAAKRTTSRTRRK